ncbi:MAG: cytochrome c maturation protein CcmE [Gammaproteobacteria bacterium]|nr:cytochrome c maturation protein CcmE [Gammaproteobacteria bacterium]
MNTARRKKLTRWLVILTTIAIAIGLMLYALKQNINLFLTPTELFSSNIQPNQIVRIGGYVGNHSVQYAPSGKKVTFAVTDKKHTLNIQYEGVLPTLFREGQGVVITGRFNSSHQFIADQVLAKHDETYMPASLKKALQRETA